MISLIEPIRFSDEFVWDIDRAEEVRDWFERYDVRAAKKIIVASRRQVESLDLVKHGDYFRDYLLGVSLKPDVDWEQIDLTMPIIFGLETEGASLLSTVTIGLQRHLSLNASPYPLST